jgi:hypothetical protein
VANLLRFTAISTCVDVSGSLPSMSQGKAAGLWIRPRPPNTYFHERARVFFNTAIYIYIYIWLYS